MVAQAPGSSGQGNQGEGKGEGGSGSGNQQGGAGTSTTTTSQSSNQATTTSNPFSSTTSTLSPASTTASSSSGVSKGVVIGAVVGGFCALLIIALLVTCCLQRRKKKQLVLENGRAQPVTYAGLNSAFSGVPFRNSQTQQTLIPGAAQHGSGYSSNSSSPALRGGALSDPTLSAAETDLFLPTYAESQAASHSPISARATTDLQNMSPQTPGAISHLYSASPRTPRAAFSHNIINPQLTGASEFQTITPQTTGGQTMRPPQFPQTGRSRDTIDTMGFPVEEDFEMLRLQHPVPNIPVAIVAPIPRHPLVHQDSLERVVRDGMVPSPSPSFSIASAADPRTRVLSHVMGVTESPVLGDPNRARFPAQQLQPSGLGLGVSRNDTQRTVSTVSSMGVSVVSDVELDRLGVGSRVGDVGAEPRVKPLRYH